MRPFRINERMIVATMEKHNCTEREAEDMLRDEYEAYADQKFQEQRDERVCHSYGDAGDPSNYGDD
jgi:hypothetical protein